MNLMHRARVFAFIVHAHRAAGKDKAGDIGAGDIAGFVEPDVTHEDIPFAEKTAPGNRAVLVAVCGNRVIFM